jgi:hypothetical protein
VVRLVVILIVISFPVAVIFAWVYELTPEGIRRTTAAGSFEALDHAQASGDPGVATLFFDPLILRYRDDPRFAAYCAGRSACPPRPMPWQ